MAVLETEEYVVRLSWVTKKNAESDGSPKLSDEELTALEDSVAELIHATFPNIIVEVEPAS